MGPEERVRCAQRIEIPHKQLILSASVSEMGIKFWKRYHEQIAYMLYFDLDFVKQVCAVNRCLYAFHPRWRRDRELVLQVLGEPCLHAENHGDFRYYEHVMRGDNEVVTALNRNAEARAATLGPPLSPPLECSEWFDDE